MIVARGTVVAAESDSSVIRFEYTTCAGCTNQCPQTKRNELVHSEQLTIGSTILLNVPSSGLSIVMFLLLGVPLLACALSFALTRSVLWACVSMALVLLVNIGTFRHFRLADYLLRPTIRRIYQFSTLCVSADYVDLNVNR